MEILAEDILTVEVSSNGPQHYFIFPTSIYIRRICMAPPKSKEILFLLIIVTAKRVRFLVFFSHFSFFCDNRIFFRVILMQRLPRYS